MDQQFYVTLTSNNTTDPNNTIALFDTELNQQYELDYTWYVGLAEFTYTKSWFNLKKNSRLLLIDHNEKFYPADEELKAGFYNQEKDLELLINDAVTRIKGDIAVFPKISFDVYARRVNVEHGKTVNGTALYLWMSEELAEMLGLKFCGPKETSTFDENGNVRLNTIKPGLTSIRSYDISAGIHSLYIYCDIIEPSFVGDTLANVVRSVNINQDDSFGKDCENIFNPIQYHKLSKSYFRRISIGLYDDSGEIIPFKFGRTKIVLHFKRYAEGMGGEVLH